MQVLWHTSGISEACLGAKEAIDQFCVSLLECFHKLDRLTGIDHITEMGSESKGKNTYVGPPNQSRDIVSTSCIPLLGLSTTNAQPYSHFTQTSVTLSHSSHFHEVGPEAASIFPMRLQCIMSYHCSGLNLLGYFLKTGP